MRGAARRALLLQVTRDVARQGGRSGACHGSHRTDGQAVWVSGVSARDGGAARGREAAGRARRAGILRQPPRRPSLALPRGDAPQCPDRLGGVAIALAIAISPLDPLLTAWDEIALVAVALGALWPRI